MNKVRLQVMICTYKPEGLARVGKMYLPRVDGVGYLVSCQSEPLQLPKSLVRDDIKVVFSPTKGLSNNRNNALDHADTEYALIADDDLVFDPQGIGLKEIIKAFDENPSVDIATFRCSFPYPNTYPTCEHDLSKKFKGYEIKSVEIAMRLSRIKEAGLRFSPLLGIGAPYLQAAEENVFVCQCLKRGLKGRFFPVTIARHPHDTTGIREAGRKEVVRANGAFIVIAHPYTALLRIPLVAHRTPGCTLRNIYHLVWGAVYALYHRLGS